MVIESDLNHDRGFSSSTYVYGNNQPSNNVLPYKQTSLNLLPQSPLNYNLFNPGSQVISNTRSSSNLSIPNFNGDPFLSGSSFSQFSLNHKPFNLGSQVISSRGSSSNFPIQNFNTYSFLSDSSFSPPINHFGNEFKNSSHLNLSNEFKNFIQPNTSQHQFLCENGDSVLSDNVKEKNKNKGESNNYIKGRWKEEDDRFNKF